MNRSIAFWSCEPGAGRRTIAEECARYWSHSGVSTVLVTIGSAPHILDSSDPWEWIDRFESRSPELLRNYLLTDQENLAVLRLNVWPSALMTRRLAALLKRSFSWVVTSGTEALVPEYAAWLENADLVLAVARPGPISIAGYKFLLTQLAEAHLPHALGQPIFNRLSAKDLLSKLGDELYPGKSVIARIAEDNGNGLRLKRGICDLARQLESQESLYESRPPQGSAETINEIVEQIKSKAQPELLRTMVHDQEASSNSLLGKDSAQKTVETCLAEDATLSVSREERSALLTRVLDDVLGLGPIEPLLKDPEISEVMINGRGCIYVERKGRLYPTDVQFGTDAQLRAVIDRIVAPLGRRVDESMPLCDARLADGSRVNIILPPLAIDGPTVTIRKFMTKALRFEDLVALDSLSQPMADFLQRCVLGRKNIVVSGGTGSGKTTLLNALSSLIPDDERIVTIEDAAELRLQKPHVVRLESRPPNAEGEGAIPIRRLVMNALRMRPDRIVIGECRGGEALDMLQAMNTGHDGSLTTVHSNSPRDALGRLETLVLMAGMDLPIRVVREQIRSAVHVIIQQTRLATGARKVTSVTEVTGMEGDLLATQELFRYRLSKFESTGIISRVLGEEAA